MKCPYCGETKSRVVETRTENNFIRRRRKCQNPECGKRFTTEETVKTNIMIKKSDGRLEEFKAEKIEEGIRRACRHRPVPEQRIKEVVQLVQEKLLAEGGDRVSSEFIGRLVAQELRFLDDIAYVRFVSVYRRLHDVDELLELVQDFREWKQAEAAKEPSKQSESG